MSKDVAVVFTAKSVETILTEGGTSSWRLDRSHARRCAYAICTRNAHAHWVEGREAHQSAFLVGRVSDVVLSPSRPDRFLIQFSEYALVNVPNVWKGDRNPIRYAFGDELKVDFTKLDWIPMPKASLQPASTSPSPMAPKSNDAVQPLSMVDAKKGLALTFGVAPEAIEITIRG